MCHRLRALSFGSFLLASAVASPAASQSPPIDVELTWRMESLIKGAQYVFAFQYGASSELSAQDFAEYFPAEAFGGVRDKCEYGSAEGIVVDLEHPVTWTGGLAFGALVPELFIIGPDQVGALVDGTQHEAVSSHLSVFDASLAVIGANIAGGKTSGFLILDADFRSGATAWQANLTFDCWCSYRDPSDGTELGRLSSFDVGGSPSTVTAFGNHLPSIVPTQLQTWGSVKSRF